MTKRSENRQKKVKSAEDRAKHARRPVTPEVLREIGTMWLKGRSQVDIARTFGIDEKAVRYHLQNHIRPMWHDQMRSRLDEDLAKVALLEATAWERFHSQAPGETHEQIEKALRECKGGQSRLRIVKQAVRSVTRTGESAWLQIIQWCLDFRARIHAHYAPVKTHIDLGGDLRVAGMGPAEVDQVMLQRLMEQIELRRKNQAALMAGRN